MTRKQAIELVQAAAFQDALRKYAQAPTVSDIVMARAGVNPGLVYNLGGIVNLLTGTRRFPRYSFTSPTSLWRALEQQGRRF